MDRAYTVILKTRFRTNKTTFFTLDDSVFSSNCVCLARSPVLNMYQVLSPFAADLQLLICLFVQITFLNYLFLL